MFLVSLYRLIKLFQYFSEPIVFYARLGWDKIFPEKPQQRLQMQRGQGLVEYALVLVLVAVVVIAILSILGPQVGKVFFQVQCSFEGGWTEESGSYAGRLDCNSDTGPYIFGNTIGFYEADGNMEWAD